jgi:phosphohistidine phosphatase
MLTSIGLIKSSEIVSHDQLYLADPHDITKVIEKHFPFSTKRVFLIGHNPGMTVLADLIPNIKLDHLPTGGVIHIQYPKDSKSWNWSHSKIQSVIYPKLLKS